MNSTSIFSAELWRRVWQISKPFFMSDDAWFQAYGLRADMSDTSKNRFKQLVKLFCAWAFLPLLAYLFVYAVGGIFHGLGVIAGDWSFVPAVIGTVLTSIGQFVLGDLMGSTPVAWLVKINLWGDAGLAAVLGLVFTVLVFKRRLAWLLGLALGFAALVPALPYALPYLPTQVSPAVLLVAVIGAVAIAIHLMQARKALMVFLGLAAVVLLFFGSSVLSAIPAIGGLDYLAAAISAWLSSLYSTVLAGFGVIGLVSLSLSRTPGAIIVEKITYTEKWKAWGLLVLLAFFLLSVNMMNVGINTVAGAFQDALQSKDQPTYWHNLFMYGGIFLIATPVVVFFAWVKSLLVIVWRRWFTRYMLEKYFLGNNYYRLSNNLLVDNPDERIANDVEGFTGGALSLCLTVVDSIITFISFFAILWMISPKLVSVVFVYALVGTGISVLLSFKMIKLSYNQKRVEADYRYNLVRVRDNVESIAFYRGAESEKRQVLARLDAAIENNMQIISYSRNVSMFQKAFDYMVVIIPAYFIAPLFFAGQVKFGAFTQANLAFNQVLSSLSLFVGELGTISAFAAYVTRLSGFMEALSAKDEYEKEATTTIDLAFGDKIAMEHVTLFTPDGKKKLLDDVSLEVPKGTGLIIKGRSGSGKSSSLRGFGGLWRFGSGKITRPPVEKCMFLSQRPYMILGTLRQQLLYPGIHPEAPESAQQQALLRSLRSDISDDALRGYLLEANFGEIADRYPEGLDAVRNWTQELSGGEQQRLIFARLLVHKPDFVFLDEVTSALDEENEERLYRTLQHMGATYVSVGHRSTLDKFHAQSLSYQGNARWEVARI